VSNQILGACCGRCQDYSSTTWRYTNLTRFADGYKFNVTWKSKEGLCKSDLIWPRWPWGTIFDWWKFQSNKNLGIERPHDNGWKMNSVQHWGENPLGDWKLEVLDKRRNYYPQADRILLSWRLHLFGTSEPIVNDY